MYLHYTWVTNLNFQIALLLSMEATEHELLQRELKCSLVVLHETVLKKVKEATISFTKNLKSVTNSNITSSNRRLNELKNTNDQGINNQDIPILEHDILEIETDWIKNQISEDKNDILLEDERPSRSFLNMEVDTQISLC